MLLFRESTLLSWRNDFIRLTVEQCEGNISQVTFALIFAAKIVHSVYQYTSSQIQGKAYINFCLFSLT